MLIAMRTSKSQVVGFIAAAVLDSGDMINLKANE